MCVPSAKNLAAAGMCWLPARAFPARSPRSKRKSWRKFVMLSVAAPDGVLLVDKAEGMTSHDVVALVRRQLRIRKVGHCGTLDPIATGLLLLTIGRGTKVQDLLMSEDKEYVGTLTLGTSTSTQDRQGDVVEAKPVPQLSESAIRAAFERFRGDFYQIAPTDEVRAIRCRECDHGRSNQRGASRGNYPANSLAPTSFTDARRLTRQIDNGNSAVDSGA